MERSMSKLDCVKCLLEENEDRTRDYLNQRTQEAKLNITLLPYAYNRHPNLQNRLLVYYIIHEFLETLNLTQTLLIFNKETAFRATDYNEYVPMFGMEWLMKSFLMHAGYTGVLPAILHNFEAAYQRLLDKAEDDCNIERLVQSVEKNCDRARGLTDNCPNPKSISALNNTSKAPYPITMHSPTAPPMPEESQRRGSYTRRALSRNTTDLNEATTALIEDIEWTPERAACGHKSCNTSHFRTLNTPCSMPIEKVSCPMPKSTCCSKQPADDEFHIPQTICTTRGPLNQSSAFPSMPPTAPPRPSGWDIVKSCLAKIPQINKTADNTGAFSPNRYSTPSNKCATQAKCGKLVAAPGSGGSPGCRPVNQSAAAAVQVKTCPPPVIGPNECAITDSQPCCPPVPQNNTSCAATIPKTIHGHVDNTPGSPLTADQLSAAAMGEPIGCTTAEEQESLLAKCCLNSTNGSGKAAALTKENVSIHQFLEGVDNAKGSNFRNDYVKTWEPPEIPTVQVVNASTVHKQSSELSLQNWPRAVKKALMKHKTISAWMFPEEADRILRDVRKCGHANGPACGCVRPVEDVEEFEAPVCYRGKKSDAQLDEERIQRGLSRVCTDLRDFRGGRRTEMFPKTGKQTLSKNT